MARGLNAELFDHLRAARRRPFAMGHHDCWLFVAEWWARRGGPDLAAATRGTYDDVPSGLAVAAGLGWPDPAACIAAHLPEIVAMGGPAPQLALAGDIALVPGDGGLEALGIVGHGRVHVATPPVGIGWVPLSRALRAWRIG